MRVLERPRWRWTIVGVCALAAFVLGWVGFIQRSRLAVDGRSAWDALYLALQLFTMESGSITTPVPAALGVARFLAPAVTVSAAAVAALVLLRSTLEGLRPRRWRGHAIVCGLGQRGVRIVEELLKGGYKVAAIELDDENARAPGIREAGCSVLVGDATDPVVLCKAGIGQAAYLVAVCSEDEVNAEIAIRARTARRSSGEPSHPLEIVSQIYDTELKQHLQRLLGGGLLSAEKEAVAVRFFNVPEKGAEEMLRQVPPVAPKGADRAPNIVVVGLGKFGRCVVEQAARQWDEMKRSGRLRGTPAVIVVDSRATDKAKTLQRRLISMGLAGVCVISPLDYAKTAAELETGEFLRRNERGEVCEDAIYICPDDDVHACVLALALRAHTRRVGVPIAVRMTEEAGLATLLREDASPDAAQVKPIDVLGSTCSLDALGIVSRLH
jgi:voltage-gated potassium channel Kch